jgi:hypothetical protein
MQLSNDDLSQLNEDELLNLSEEELRRISIKLLTDLKEARERLSQNSRNSSCPPSSEAPWEKETQQGGSDKQCEETEENKPSDKNESLPVDKPDKESRPTKNGTEEPRKPGKQIGAKGFGRTQKIAITHYQDHVPQTCECCQHPLNAVAKKAITAFETIDLEWADDKTPGLRLTNTKHSYYEISCYCGHITQKEPNRSNSLDTLQDITCSQWRLVGPGLASLIICLTYRMRLSRERVQEFLSDWLGLQLSIGTINNTLHESGAAALPIQEELVKEIVASQQLHVDETSWMELTTFLWLWVFSTESVTAYWIATRSSELIENILGQAYCGWLMSDGYQVYRRYLNRVRCWAHLIRKANGLQEGLDRDSQLFGKKTLDLMNMLITAIREARTDPPDKPLTETYQTQIIAYQQLCKKMKNSAHKKTKALATEMLNDWEAIFRILEYPHLPLTNNEAERALRHWVILRRISYGTRTEEGSCVFAILISVIETCRKRQQSPWIYLASVIHNRRVGIAIPNLPIAKGAE